MTREEIERKAFGLMSPVLGSARTHALIEAIWSIEQCADVRALRPLLIA